MTNRSIPQRGEGIITVLMALSIISIAFVGAAVFYKSKGSPIRRDISSSADCRDIAEGAIQILRDNGIALNIPSYAYRSSTVIDNLSGVRYSDGLVQDSHRYISGSVLLGSGAQPLLNTAYTIEGSMNAIAAIYNSSPSAFCSQSKGANYAAITPWLVQGNIIQNGITKFKNVVTTIKIEPYDIRTSAALGCLSAPIYVRPAPQQVDSTGLSSGESAQVIQFAANNYAYVGFHVTAYVSLDQVLQPGESASNAHKECTAMERFQFQRDGDAPPQPDVSTVLGNNAGPGAPLLTTNNNCPANSSTAISFQIGYSSGMTPGTVLMCRDASYMWQAPPSGSAETYCQLRGDYMPLPGHGNLLIPGRAANPWMPCDQVQVCNTNPSSATATLAGGTQLQYTLSYNGIPYGCNAAVEYIGVDPAGNISISGSTAAVARVDAQTQAPNCWSCTHGSQPAGAAPGQSFCNRDMCNCDPSLHGGGGTYAHGNQRSQSRTCSRTCYNTASNACSTWDVPYDCSYGVTDTYQCQDGTDVLVNQPSCMGNESPPTGNSGPATCPAPSGGSGGGGSSSTGGSGSSATPWNRWCIRYDGGGARWADSGAQHTPGCQYGPDFFPVGATVRSGPDSNAICFSDASGNQPNSGCEAVCNYWCIYNASGGLVAGPDGGGCGDPSAVENGCTATGSSGLTYSGANEQVGPGGSVNLTNGLNYRCKRDNHRACP